MKVSGQGATLEGGKSLNLFSPTLRAAGSRGRSSSMGRSGRLNEKATLENRLENADEGVRFGPQAYAKALFRLPENVIEIGTDQGVGATAEDGDQVAELAFPDECEAVLGQIEGGFHAAVRGLEFGIEIADPLLDPPRGNMAAGI